MKGISECCPPVVYASYLSLSEGESELNTTISGQMERMLLFNPSERPRARDVALAIMESIFDLGPSNALSPEDLLVTRPSPGFHTILDIISVYTTKAMTAQIATQIDSYFKMRNTTITGFRVSPLFPSFVEYESRHTFLIIQWREGNQTDALAIFKTSSTDVPCSSLMHVGIGFDWEEMKQWRESFVTWQVTEIRYLIELLKVLYDILLLRYSSNDDLIKRWNTPGISEEWISEEEYMPVFID